MNAHYIANSGVQKIKPYVPGKPIEEVKQEFGLDKVIKMASNENCYGASETAKQAIRELTEQIHLYPHSLSSDFREKLSQLLQVDTEMITVGNGADGVLHNLGMTIVDQEDEFIIPETTFPLYSSIVRAMRGTVVTSRMDGLSIDTDDILERITDRTKAIFFCNPNNPTGDALPADRVHEFLKQVPDHILVVIDEAYIDFADRESTPESIRLFLSGMNNLFIIRTLSKIYGLAGVRLGYGIGDTELISLINRVKPPFDVSSIAQKAGVAALSDEQFRRYTLEKTNEEKRYFYSELTEMGLTWVPSQTNFILIDTGVDSKAVFENLQKHGIIIRPGKNFGLPTHIRVTLGTHEENVQFFEAFKKVLVTVTKSNDYIKAMDSKG
jgi:histidinol-phosphate aminotransferase